jgi:hypothetical protein
MLASAWLAYSVVASERLGRSWASVTTVGVFLALFGGISFGLLSVWASLAPKLVDQIASDNTRLFIGLIVTAALVVLVLDLLGTISVMSRVQDSINRPTIGGGTGDD